MKSWPSLRVVVPCWSALTFVACLAFALYPPGGRDELEMANTLSFRLLVAALLVGIPSVGCLFAFLLVGALVKRPLTTPSSGQAQAALDPAAHVER